MPELPDITVYVERIAALAAGHRVAELRVESPFVLRTVAPPLGSVIGKTVVGARRLGKRIIIELEGNLFVAIHLMISGRLHWFPTGTAGPKRVILAALELDHGLLTLTEAGTKRRASIHVVDGEAGLERLCQGGLEVLESDATAFRAAILAENHTLKRTLTDPRILSGIGNAYSDEILHRARLSPVAQTQRLDAAEIDRLRGAVVAVLTEWTDRLRREAEGGFPEKVTAFRDGMAVHGRYRLPCPVCRSLVQRIRYAENETNYCPRCQTGGRILADRSLSRLLKDDWPKRIEELERCP